MASNFLKRTYQRGKDNFKSQLGELRDSILPRELGELGEDFFPDGGERLIFPNSMQSESAASRPMVSFTIEFEKGKAPSTVYFPCPGGITFGDNGNYGTVSLGMLGAMSGTALNALSQNSLSDAGGQIVKTLKSKNLSDVVMEGIGMSTKAGNVLGVDTAGLASFATQRVQNPRENTTFQSNQARSFSFSFKLMAASAAEAELVRKIHFLFQKSIYAKPIPGSLNALQFPPVSEIKFLFKGKENPHIPKIHKCYLTGMTSTYNSGANSYRTNGEPMEVDFALNFNEVRVLTRDDIEELAKPTPNRDKGERGRFDEIGREASQKIKRAIQEVKAPVTTDGPSPGAGVL